MGRLNEAVADLAETLRRAFRDPAVRAAPPALESPASAPAALLEVRVLDPEALAHATVAADLPARLEALRKDLPMAFSAPLCEEQGWTAWARGATPWTVPIFQAQTVPFCVLAPLPSRACGRQVTWEGWHTRTQGAFQRLPNVLSRRAACGWEPPRVRQDLERVLALPVSVHGAPWSAQSKALQMRYALELVKATGENIRNVEVLGVFHIPDQGVRDMRHDPRQQRLLLRLDAAARHARRRPFLLARRREDGALVSCFLDLH